MKKLTLVIFVFLLVGSLAWAGGNRAVSGNDVQTLRVLSVYTPDHSVGPMVDVINARFAEKYPNIRIEMQTMPSDNLESVLRTDFETGNPPAVFQVWTNNQNLSFIEAGRWLDLNQILNSDTEWRDGFHGGALDAHRYGTDGIWGLPQASFALGIYYNKELFRRAGIVDVPKTIDDLLNVSQRLQTIDGVVPMVFGNLTAWRSVHLFGATFYKLHGTERAFDFANRTVRHDSNEIIETYEYMQMLAASGLFGRDFIGLEYADEVSLFNEGRAAMRFSGTWTLGEVSESLDVGFFPFPYFADRPQFRDDWFAGYAEGWAVSSGLSPALEQAAIDYVRLWTGADGMKAFAEVARNIPAGAAEVDAEKTGELFATVVEKMSSIGASLADFAAPEINPAVAEQIVTNAQAILAGAVTPVEAAARLQATVGAGR